MEPLGPNQHAFQAEFLRRWGQLIADALPKDIFDPATWTNPVTDGRDAANTRDDRPGATH
jgi:hypothetical protein